MNKPLFESYELKRVRLTPGELKITSKSGLAGETEAFVAIASAGKVPLEVVRVKKDNFESLPLSVRGKTLIRFVGATPMILAEPDVNGNLKMMFAGKGAVEVIFNSLTVGAQGRNRGPHGKKKIYIVE